MVVLPLPCSPDQHDDGRLRLEFELGGAAAEELDELVVDDFDDLLARRHAFDDLLPDAFGLDPLDEFGGDFDVDVGIEQREADLPHRIGDVGFGQGALSAQFAENIMQLVA